MENSLSILGVSFDFHDAAAALMQNGEVVAAAQEERFSRCKHDPRLPTNAMNFCLSKGGITPNELDCVVFYEQPLLKLDRLIDSTFDFEAPNIDSLKKVLLYWFEGKKLDVRDRLRESLGITNLDIPIVTVPHHMSHAASAFHCSPFEQAVIVTIDGVGEYQTCGVFLGNGLKITPVWEVRYPHSIGLFYSAFTSYLGFEVNEGEYKVMGMAGFGEPNFYDKIKPLISLLPDGRFEIDQKYFSFLASSDRFYSEELTNLLGPARDIIKSGQSIEQRFFDIASSVQKVTEEAILHIVSTAISDCGTKNICMAGGVALNSLTNGRIIRELDANLYIHPAAGDAGGAIGSAALINASLSSRRTVKPLTSAYLGSEFSDEEILAAIKRSGYTNFTKFGNSEDLINTVSQLLAQGNVVGWYQGRSEWGPRALGNRSILADPRDPGMQNKVNRCIKFREEFRPFAPSVPYHAAPTFFEMPFVNNCTAPECFMLAVHKVIKDKMDIIPSVTHADGTARVHVVFPDVNPRFYNLLESFGQQTGVPVLLNTSFNLKGEPIVDTPTDAINTFSYCDMTALAIGNFLIRKEL